MAPDLLSLLGVAASVFAGLVFLEAAIGKLRHRQLLPGVIANYRLLPAALVAPAALLLPPAELLLAALLLAGITPLAPLAAIGLLLLFAAAMAINIVRGRRHIDCGCGHAGLRQQLGWAKVARNLAMAAALVPALADPGLGLGDRAVAAAAGLGLYVMLLIIAALQMLPGSAARSARG